MLCQGRIRVPSLLVRLSTEKQGLIFFSEELFWPKQHSEWRAVEAGEILWCCDCVEARALGPWGCGGPGPQLVCIRDGPTTAAKPQQQCWENQQLEIKNTYISQFAYVLIFLCGSVVEHCVSSAKGCGFDSQGTHILMKRYNLNAIVSRFG